MTETELREAVMKSLGALRQLGPEIQWIHSYVTDDKIYCIYFASDEKLIHEHLRIGGSTRIDRIEAVRFEPSFVDRATRDMRISCALESMLGLARDLGLRTFGHFGTEECASVSDRYDFDYLPVPIGMVDTLKSITAPFNSARTQATVTAGR